MNWIRFIIIQIILIILNEWYIRAVAYIFNVSTKWFGWADLIQFIIIDIIITYKFARKKKQCAFSYLESLKSYNITEYMVVEIVEKRFC